MDANALFTAALGLIPPWLVESIDFDEAKSEVNIHLDFGRGGRFSCPSCGSKDCPVHDTTEKRWRHLNFFQHKAFLMARVPRIKCESCGVKLVDVPWGRKDSGFTLLFEALVMQLATHMPIAPLARLVEETDMRLWRIIKHYVEEAVDRIDCEDLENLGVDETSARRGHDYVTLFYDLDQKRLVFVADGKDAETFEDFDEFVWEHNGNTVNIREVSCDMSPAFRKGIREITHNAHITFDRFHIAKMLNEAVDKVRKKESRKDKTVKGSKYIWLRRPERLTARQKERLSELSGRFGVLAEAYRLKESFRDFYEQPDQKSGRGFLKGWIADALQSGIAPIIKVAQTVRDHWNGLMRWHVTKINNGVMEALASLIQAAKRKARGYRVKGTLRIMAYLIAGRLDLRLPT